MVEEQVTKCLSTEMLSSLATSALFRAGRHGGEGVRSW